MNLYRGAQAEYNGTAVTITGEYVNADGTYYTIAEAAGKFRGKYEARGNYHFLVLTRA